jgi:hypothetical protein
MKFESAKLLADIQDVIKQYPGIKMTVRQVYYRLVASQKVKNAQSEYNRVKRVLSEARLNGDISFDDIEDRTRKVREGEEPEYSAKGYFNSYHNWFRTLDEHYELPRWYAQPTKVVVLVEKQALEGIFVDVCDEKAVDLVVCRGYPSLSVLHELAKRLKGCGTQEIKLLYFGDYDPSGLDIDRNVAERMKWNFDVKFDFTRISITRDQIDEYDIPPAPAKDSDSRTRGMEIRLGEAMQVELDAIDPPDLIKIIGDAIEEHFDSFIYDDARADELANRRMDIKKWVSEVMK